ncbi:hypothetical protein BGZ46_009845 [Entomortierella lignicola]|nr:hypothetical protein BGZ46_009845 [Entomortierella lignicola]
MMEQKQSQFEYDQDEQEYYNEEEEEGVEYGNEYENEEEYEDQDGETFQVGQEINLTHQEVWDDSALIEAWDKAVKHYEVYHSKTKSDAKAITSSPLPKTKNTITSTSPNKRVKLNDGHSVDAIDSITDKSSISENSAGPKPQRINSTLGETSVNSITEQEVPAVSTAATEESTEYATTERKPSFKKADKSGFNRYKESRPDNSRSIDNNNNNKNQKSRTESSRAKTNTPQQHPSVDAATIAYYQQLGYYYDPSYDPSSTHQPSAETGGEDQDQGHDEGITHSRVQSKGRSNRVLKASLSTSSDMARSAKTLNSNAKNSPKSSSNTATANAGTSSTTFGHQGSSFWPGSMPAYPAYQQGYYPGVGPNGFGVAGIPQGWGARGAAPMPMPMPMPMPVPSMSTGGVGQHPVGMMPPPPMMSGQFSGAGMDDEALSNLIMAWYFSGYYTGLYQAQRR